jgi:hypothetical protein
MTPADFASWGDVAGGDEAWPGEDDWADIWNRQRSTKITVRKCRGRHREVGTRQSGWRVPSGRIEETVERL